MTKSSFDRHNLPRDLFVANEYVKSSNGGKLTLYNPKDGSLVADDVSLAGEKDVESAVVAAEKAFPDWKRTTAAQRGQLLSKLADLIESCSDTFSELTRITLGTPVSTFGKREIAYAVQTCRYYAGWADKFAGESFPQDDGFMRIVRNEPLGVTAGIIPWNAPLGSAALKWAPALITGNCFILKPSEKTPFASLALGELIMQAGYPAGVFQILSGDGSTGALLASHPRIRKVSFTGSILTGKKIQELAAKSNLKRVTLELGGKSPAVVFADCDLENAVKWTTENLVNNTGQICFAATRLLIQESISEKFLARYKQELHDQARKVGDPDLESTSLGPLVDRAQFDRVQGFVDRETQRNKPPLIGGRQVGDKGYFFEPTVFVNPADHSEICTEEIFGPVAVVHTFKTEEEVVGRCNESEYGLMAGVFTQDINRALRVASDIDSGMVGINCISMFLLNAPFGGSKQSGIGRECGSAALRAFTEPKTIMVNMSR